MRIFSIGLLSFVMMGACGARSELATAGRGDVITTPDARDDAATPADRPTSFDASTDAVTPDVVTGPCNWQVGTMSFVTRLPNDQFAGRPLAVEGGVLVPYTNNNDPSPDPRQYIQRVDELGAPQGERAAVLDHAGSYGAMSVAQSGAAFAAMAWDEGHGCRFVNVDARGAAVSSARVVSDRLCGVRDGQDGFLGLEDTNAVVRLRVLELDGRERSTSTTIADETHVGSAVIVFDDFTLGAAWITTGDRRVRYAHYGAAGEPLTMPVDVGTGGPNAMTVRLAPIGDHVLVAWQQSHDDADRTRDVFTASIARDGSVLRMPSLLAGASPLPGRNELAMRTAHGDVLLGYIVGESLGPWQFEIQVLDSNGMPRTSPLAVNGMRAVLDLGLVETSIGALATYVTAGPERANQVAATPIRCNR